MLAKLVWSLIVLAWQLAVLLALVHPLVVLLYPILVLVCPLVVVVFPLAVLVCPFVCPFVVFVCPPVVLLCPLVVSVCPLVVLVALSASLFITDRFLFCKTDLTWKSIKPFGISNTQVFYTKQYNDANRQIDARIHIAERQWNLLLSTKLCWTFTAN